MSKLKYYNELDGVRAIAAVAVMFFHFFVAVPATDPTLAAIRKFSFFGQTGVSLFFVLSGFLITRILLQSRGADNYFSSFYLRRMLRIFPLYYLFLAIYYLALPLLHQPAPPADANRIYYWLYLQNFATTFGWPTEGPMHFWSLAVEEHFYMFWPLVVYWAGTKRIVPVIAAIIGLSLLTRWLLVSNQYDPSMFTFGRMDELAIGALLAVLELKGKLNSIKPRKFLLGFVALIIPTAALWVLFSGSQNSSIQIYKFSLLSMAYFCILGYIVTTREGAPIKNVLKSKPFSYSGKISYGLYVYHPLCFMFAEVYLHTGSIIANLLISFALTYITASLSFYLIESRFLNLKKYFNYSGNKTAAPVPAATGVKIQEEELERIPR